MTSFWLTQCRKQWYILDIDIKDDHFRRNRIDAKRQNLPIVCGTLVVINVIVYLICTFTGDLLYNIGELDAVAVLRYGEYGRILSSTFYMRA